MTTHSPLAHSTCELELNIVNIGSGPMAKPFGNNDDDIGIEPLCRCLVVADVQATSFVVSSTFTMLFQSSLWVPASNHEPSFNPLVEGYGVHGCGCGVQALHPWVNPMSPQLRAMANIGLLHAL